MISKLDNCLNYIRSITDFKPKVALVLGSGLGGFSRQIAGVECVIPYEKIPGFPVSTVSGHEGKFVMGHLHGVPVICMDGRIHYYEGYTPEEVVLPIRVMRAMGAEILFLTNAAGGIRSDLSPGTLVLLRDHISLFMRNPLIGPNDPHVGERFPDMSDVYDHDLRVLIRRVAEEENLELQSGVYCQLTGPSYETPSEVMLLERLGVDMVGMSTVIEAIAAKHAGMKVCGISLITNYAAGLHSSALTHEEVKEAGAKATPRFSRIVSRSVAAMKDI
ncbi:MAG TPA: purine-nucleoside phosphorylase [Lachnospiraceae bacterium]|nr:purine-nucleoside phosphorylase [Lachnospiraceae bacterium]